MVVIGVPADPEASAVVYAVAGTKKSSADDFRYRDQRIPQAEQCRGGSVNIPKNAFARRLVPDEAVETIGVPTVLAANRIATGPVRTKVYNNAITELTKA